MPTPVATSDLQQKIRDALEDSRQLGRLAAVSTETYENTLNHTLLFAGAVEGQVRHIRLADRDLWVSYQPAFFTLSALKDGKPHVLSHGDIYVHICTDHGQIWHKRVDEGKHATMMQFGDAELLEQIRFSMRREEFDAISKGDILNSIAPTRAPKVTGGDPHWQSLLNSTPLSRSPGPENFKMSTFNVGDSFRSSSGHIGALGASLESVTYINMHVSRFQGYEFFHELSGRSNTYEAELAFEKLTEELICQGTMTAHNAAVDKQVQILEAAGVRIDWRSKRNQLLYTIPVMNFIVEGATSKSKLYRAQFVEQSFGLLFFDADTPIPPQMNMESAWCRLRELVADTSNSAIRPDQTLVDLVDRGEYPSSHLAKKWGLPHLSKGQFQRAMHLFGAYQQLTGKGTSFRHPFPSIVSAISDRKDPFAILALAKLPAEWFRWDQSGDDILSAQGVSALYQKYTAGKDELLNATTMLMDKRALPYLVATGKELDRLRGEQNALLQSGQDDIHVKKKIRELGLQWRWMTSGPGSMGQRLSEFDEKYKVTASYNDYPGILHQLWSAVYFRTILDHDYINPDESIGFSHASGQISWDDDAIHQQVMEHLDDSPESEPEMDEANDPVDDVPPSEYYAQSSAPDRQEIDTLIRQNQTDFRSPVRMNDELHKVYSTFLREANTGSSVEVSWIPLLDAPLKFPGFELHSINTRLELLTEGSEMKHCVFSYLNQCMSGESIILSARENGTGNRIATIEIKPEQSRAYDSDSPIRLELQQCYGYRNSSGEKVDAVKSAIEEWIARVNRGEFPTNASRIVNDKTHLEDLFSIIEKNPAQNGAMLQSIPYTEDGVFLAYYLFNKYTPDGVSIQQLVEQDTVISMVYHHSQFRRDIATIEAIAEKYQHAPESVVRTKMQHGLTSWPQVATLMDARQQCQVPVSSMLSEYDGQMTTEQIFQKSSVMLAHYGLQFNPGYTADQFERDRHAGVDWMIATAPSSKSQPVSEVDAPRETVHPSVRRRA